MKAIMDHPLFRNFVSPTYCVYLEQADLKLETPYHWRCLNGTAALNTHYFDVDGYNRDAMACVDYANGHTVKIIPAFTAEDMQMILPDFFMSRLDGTDFSVSMVEQYPMDIMKSKRMADCMALAVLECIRKRYILPETAKRKLMNLA